MCVFQEHRHALGRPPRSSKSRRTPAPSSSTSPSLSGSSSRPAQCSHRIVAPSGETAPARLAYALALLRTRRLSFVRHLNSLPPVLAGQLQVALAQPRPSVIDYPDLSVAGGQRHYPGGAPGRVVPSLALRREDGLPEPVCSVQARVRAASGGAARRVPTRSGGSCAGAPEPSVLVDQAGQPSAGIAALGPQSGGELEIRAFGLPPEYVGWGIGGHALALQRAWATAPLEPKA